MQSCPKNNEFTNLDLEAFARDLDALRTRVRRELGERDLKHLARIERWGRTCTALGYASAWVAPNPVSMVLLSQGRLTRWAMVAHHVSHRGYDRVPNVSEARTSAGFARGKRRLLDWMDWIDPEAWNQEHNRLHHYRLGETEDPDMVELNLDWLRNSPVPEALKLPILAFFAATWKWTYYAPNTLRLLLQVEQKRTGQYDRELPTLLAMFKEPALWERCLLPYAGLQFVGIPLLFLPLSIFASANVLINSLCAEILTNVHSFAVITTNHAGEDLYAFDEPVSRGKAEFYLRQVLGSANFQTGGDLVDFLHGFLNYQIEHHLFPDLPMSAYQRIQPDVKRICEKHGVPYVQESIFVRLRKTIDVMLGKTSMRRSESLAFATQPNDVSAPPCDPKAGRPHIQPQEPPPPPPRQ